MVSQKYFPCGEKEGRVQYVGQGKEQQGTELLHCSNPYVLPFPSPLTLPKHTSQDGMEIGALRLQAAQLGE